MTFEYIEGFFDEPVPEDTSDQADLEVLILKSKSMKNKKLIGYKAPMDLFGGKVVKGTTFKPTSSNPTPTPMYLAVENNKLINPKFELPAEIVEQWEPVYKEEFKAGNWIKVIESSNKGYNGKPGKLYRIIRKSNNFLYYGPSDCIDTIVVKVVLATSQEIKDHLVSLAKEKGFVHNAEFTAVRDTEPNKELDSQGIYSGFYSKDQVKVSIFTYNMETDTLTTSGWGLFVVYSQGKWATLKKRKEVITLCSSSGNFDLEVSKEGIYYAKEKIWLDVQSVEELASIQCSPALRWSKDHPFFISKKKGSYTINVRVDVGCKDAVPVKAWKKVWQEYKKFHE